MFYGWWVPPAFANNYHPAPQYTRHHLACRYSSRGACDPTCTNSHRNETCCRMYCNYYKLVNHININHQVIVLAYLPYFSLQCTVCFSIYMIVSSLASMSLWRTGIIWLEGGAVGDVNIYCIQMQYRLREVKVINNNFEFYSQNEPVKNVNTISSTAKYILKYIQDLLLHKTALSYLKIWMMIIRQMLTFMISHNSNTKDNLGDIYCGFRMKWPSYSAIAMPLQCQLSTPKYEIKYVTNSSIFFFVNKLEFT